ncbi:MAG: M23 family metallopeptidase [Anaerolineae bacterium]|nr:M23 family metallopeptidase [Anaerolineae bacterium]
MVRKLTILVIFAFVLNACQPVDVVTPFVATIDPTYQALAQNSTPVPTAGGLLPSRTPTIPVTPTDTATPTETPTPTLTPSSTYTPTLFPTNTRPPTLTLTPTPLELIIASATVSEAELSGTPRPTLTPPPPDPSVQVADHFMFRRPVSDTATNWVDRNYPYGATNGGRLQVHHGVEFVNPRGTPLYAVADGVVYYAGDDLTSMFGPITNYYGNLVVIQHNATAPDGRPLFTLYGHMDQIAVQTGQPVSNGQQIGTIGATGVAMGPHVHFEVRVGDPQCFCATRNPELWIRPYPTYGTLAGRVTDAAGNILYDVTLKVESERLTRYAWTYADTTVNGDDVFGENFTLGDIPADYYMVTVGENGRVRFQQLIYLYPNRTTFINVQLN